MSMSGDFLVKYIFNMFSHVQYFSDSFHLTVLDNFDTIDVLLSLYSD